MRTAAVLLCLAAGAGLAEVLDRINPVHLPRDRHTPREKMTNPPEGQP